MVHQWQHPECMCKNMKVDYAPTARGKCKGSGEKFEKGESETRGANDVAG